MKITIYTITGCEFSKKEKEYLASKNLPFEEKNLEINKEFLTEMFAISNNFAGTPVTKIEKDDGQITVLKGFTKEEFDKVLTPPVSIQVEPKMESPALNTTQSEVSVAESTQVKPQTVGSTSIDIPPTPPTPLTSEPTPISPTVELDKTDKPAASPYITGTNTLPPTPDIAKVIEPSVKSETETMTPPPADPKLNSILNDLQSMVNTAAASTPQTSPSNPKTTNTLDSTSTPPVIPNPNF